MKERYVLCCNCGRIIDRVREAHIVNGETFEHLHCPVERKHQLPLDKDIGFWGKIRKFFTS